MRIVICNSDIRMKYCEMQYNVGDGIFLDMHLIMLINIVHEKFS